MTAVKMSAPQNVTWNVTPAMRKILKFSKDLREKYVIEELHYISL